MSIVDSVNEIIRNEETQRISDDSLQKALELYHNMVSRNIIIPRGNQLMPELIEFRSNSNFG